MDSDNKRINQLLNQSINMKKLTRDLNHRVVGGVCSGIAKYFGIDPVIVRLGFVVLSCLWGCGVIVYLLSLLIIPKEDEIKEGD
jgi:phage shock protein C